MHPVVIGTIFWVIIGTIVGYYVVKHVGTKSPIGKQWQNQKIALMTIIFCGIQMWLMWATCYMHQMYPLIEPKMEF